MPALTFRASVGIAYKRLSTPSARHWPHISSWTPEDWVSFSGSSLFSNWRTELSRTSLFPWALCLLQIQNSTCFPDCWCCPKSSDSCSAGGSSMKHPVMPGDLPFLCPPGDLATSVLLADLWGLLVNCGHYDHRVLFWAPVFVVRNSVGCHDMQRGSQVLLSQRQWSWETCFLPPANCPFPKGTCLCVIGAKFAGAGMKGLYVCFSVSYRYWRFLKFGSLWSPWQVVMRKFLIWVLTEMRFRVMI